MSDKVNILTDGAYSGDHLNATIALRIAARRKAAGLSLDRLSALSGVSKGMLVRIEQARGNPSIATLCKVASSLGVAVAELVDVGAHQGEDLRLVTADGVARLWAGPGGGSATLLVGSDGPDMLELWEWILHPGERFQAQAHAAGTQELISVAQGNLTLEVGATVQTIGAGQSAFARTDRPHVYACTGSEAVRFIMVVSETGRASPRIDEPPG